MNDSVKDAAEKRRKMQDLFDQIKVVDDSIKILRKKKERLHNKLLDICYPTEDKWEGHRVQSTRLCSGQ